MRDEPVPDGELAKAKAYLSGGLELRMDETRHLASWVGGQEALHDRVLTLDEALAAVEAVTRRGHPSPGRRPVPRRRTSGSRSSPRVGISGDSIVTCGCRHERPRATGSRAVEQRLAGIHLRLGSLSLARAELEELAAGDRARRRRTERPGRGTLADRRPRARGGRGRGPPGGWWGASRSPGSSPPRRPPRPAGRVRRGRT